MLTLWKDLCSAEKVVVLALWSCTSLLPRALQWSCLQFLSWCLVCWAWSERFANARIQLRSRQQRGLEDYLSYWENSALLGKLGSSSVTWRTWDATQGATVFAVLALCMHSSWWLLFETAIWPTFQCATNLWTCFSWSVRQKLCNEQKVLLFSDKRRSCGIAFFSILYSWQWPHKGLNLKNVRLLFG